MNRSTAEHAWNTCVKRRAPHSEGGNCFYIHPSGMTTGIYYLHIFSETKNFTGKAMVGQ
jgi:hypothetical protein